MDDKQIIECYELVRHRADGGMEDMAECNDYDTALKALRFYAMADRNGVYYQIERRYKVVES